MKKTRTICLILCVILLLPTFFTPAWATEGNSCRGVDADVALGGGEKLVETSKAVFVYERKSGTVVYAYDPDERIAPVSMVKLMTAIVALEQGNPDDICVVTRAALDSVEIGSVSAGLDRWEEISLRDLLYCMMVSSANDASAVIAEHIAGSQEAFVDLLNAKAAELGCKDTHFSDAHGLDDKEAYTTIRDVCRIIEYGLGIPEFRQMFETTHYTVPATNLHEPRELFTTNHMACTEETKKYYDERVTGGKTGASSKAGRCLAVTAQVGDMELIAIVMGAKPTYEADGLALKAHGSFEEMGEILNYVGESFEYRQIFHENQVLAQNAVAGGSSHAVVAPGKTVYCVLPKGADESLLSWSFGPELNSLSAPVANGQVVSSLQVWYEGICIAQTDLVAMNNVSTTSPAPEALQDNVTVQEEFHGEVIANILVGFLAVVIGVFVIILIIRMARRMAAKARIRRRRRNRRRNRHA